VQKNGNLGPAIPPDECYVKNKESTAMKRFFILTLAVLELMAMGQNDSKAQGFSITFGGPGYYGPYYNGYYYPGYYYYPRYYYYPGYYYRPRSYYYRHYHYRPYYYNNYYRGHGRWHYWHN
jgi:hypothetical protein